MLLILNYLLLDVVDYTTQSRSLGTIDLDTCYNWLLDSTGSWLSYLLRRTK
jgi:hypothetical protein